MYLLLMCYIMKLSYTELYDFYVAWKFLGSPLYYFESFWNYCDVAQVVSFIVCAATYWRLHVLARDLSIGQQVQQHSASVDEYASIFRICLCIARYIFS